MNVNYKKSLKILLYTFFSLVGFSLLSIASILLYQHRATVVSFTTMKPETFTELYFENNENLPTKITNDAQFSRINPTLALFTFQFTIHNVENKDMSYPYDVTEIVNGEKASIDTGTIFIKKNESKTINESFSAPKIFPKTEVIVNLPEKNQQISFWMEIKNENIK